MPESYDLLFTLIDKGQWYRLFHNYWTLELQCDFRGAPTDNFLENFILHTLNHMLSYYTVESMAKFTLDLLLWPLTM